MMTMNKFLNYSLLAIASSWNGCFSLLCSISFCNNVTWVLVGYLEPRLYATRRYVMVCLDFAIIYDYGVLWYCCLSD
jgi:hypothetical protein